MPLLSSIYYIGMESSSRIVPTPLGFTAAMLLPVFLLCKRMVLKAGGERKDPSLGKDPYISVSMQQNRAFRALTQFNTRAGLKVVCLKHRLAPSFKLYGVHRKVNCDIWFNKNSLTDRIAHTLAKYEAIDLKEFAESLEFFQSTRKALRKSGVVVDLCCGHGLTGFLFAVFEKKVDKVICTDIKRTKGFDLTLTALKEVAPWISDKVEFRQEDLFDVVRRQKKEAFFPAKSSIVGIHCCGELSDLAIDLAISLQGSIAIMPCCYGKNLPKSQPKVIKRVFGRGAAMDIARTEKLHQAGYNVNWTVVPRAISDKNRILIGKKS